MYVNYINIVEPLLTHISRNSYTITYTFSKFAAATKLKFTSKLTPRSPQPPLIIHSLSHPPIYFEFYTQWHCISDVSSKLN